jgi:hypothetical protein
MTGRFIIEKESYNQIITILVILNNKVKKFEFYKILEKCLECESKNTVKFLKWDLL